MPKTKRHTKASHANPSCTTDGENVIAFFGSEGLYCYNFKGKLLWSKQFERMNAGFYRVPDVEWGFASSPILHEGKVIVQCDFIGDSFLAAYDVTTGDEIWRTSRSDEPTWSTPNFYNKDGVTQIIVNGYHHAGGYDFETGKEIWKLGGGGDIPVPTPIFAHDLIYLHSAHGRYSPIFAIKPNANGNITLHKDSTSNHYIKWSIKRGGAYNPTNIIVGTFLYNMRMNGQLTCFDALSGQQIYKEKLPFKKGMTASAVSSNGKIYYSGENGEVFIIRAGPNFELLAKNNLGDVIMATPAITSNSIIFRTQHYLLAIGQ